MKYTESELEELAVEFIVEYFGEDHREFAKQFVGVGAEAGNDQLTMVSSLAFLDTLPDDVRHLIEDQLLFVTEIMSDIVADEKEADVGLDATGYRVPVSVAALHRQAVSSGGPAFYFEGPPPGMGGEERHGFTLKQRVKVIRGTSFMDWYGHVRAFGDKSVAVDLDEPPEGHHPNGQWFRPEDLEAAPL